MQHCFLSLGGNIGDSAAILDDALAKIADWSEVQQFQRARLYKTSPISAVEQSDFVNTVCCFDTTLSPYDLMNRCWALERDYGIKEAIKDGPRALDIDLLFFGETSIADDKLVVPHPRWRERLFVLVPMAELVDSITLPGGEAVDLQQLIAQVSASSGQRVEKLR